MHLHALFIFIGTQLALSAFGADPASPSLTNTPTTRDHSAKIAVKFLLPLSPYSLGTQKEFNSIVDEFNAKTADAKVVLIRRGEDLSSLRELMAMNLAGDSPDLAIIDSSELEPALAAGVVQPIPKELLPLAEGHSFPFLRLEPLLFSNLDKLKALGMTQPKGWPKNWKEFLATLQKMEEKQKDLKGPWVALPLQGQRGLWLFEALGNTPLWKREQGGIRSNRKLTQGITELQKLIDHTPFARVEETWERAIQSFLDRTSPWLFGSSDLIPYLQSQATFEWSASALPKPVSTSPLISGNDLIIVKSSKAAHGFIQYLYTPAVHRRWSKAAGSLSPPAHLQSRKAPLRRTTDRDVVRARSIWVQTLHSIFGEARNRESTEDIFIRLDRALSSP